MNIATLFVRAGRAHRERTALAFGPAVLLGYGELVRPTPRRGVNEVLVMNRP